MEDQGQVAIPKVISVKRGAKIKPPVFDPIHLVPFRSQRKYITTGKKIKVRAMDKAGMKINDISALEHLSVAQVQEIVNDPSLDMLDGQINDNTKKLMGANFLQLSDLAIQMATDPTKLEKMNAFQLSIIGATAYDKFRLAENLSTQNISIQGIVQHLESEKEELKKAKEILMESLGNDVGVPEHAPESVEVGKL